MRKWWMAGVLLLTACGERGPAAPDQPFTAPGVSFSLTPSAARDCAADTVYTARLDWRVQRPGKTRLEIRVGDREGPLMARSNDSSGSAETENWVRRGTWFLLLDRRSGELLAAQRAGPESCD